MKILRLELLHRLSRVTVLGGLFLLLSVDSAVAECPDPFDGMGGTGLYPEDDLMGIGGTGVVPGDDGIGGTGVVSDDQDGVGGTGLIGTIDGFGSICVNGQRIEYDAVTVVQTPMGPGSSRDLALGQVVAVEAYGAPGRMRARSIHIVPQLKGPPVVDPHSGRVQVKGRQVHVTARTIMSSKNRMVTGRWTPTSEGSHILVHGYPRPDGSIDATRIEERASGNVVERAGGRSFPEGVQHLSVQGYAKKGLSRGAIRVGGYSFRLDREPKEDDSASDRYAGQRVIVVGSKTPSGGWQASRIRIREWPEQDRSGENNRGTASKAAGSAVEGSGSGSGSDRADRSERSDRSDRSDRTDRSERTGRADRIDRVERPDRAERPERSERPERVERIERAERPERAERVERTDRPERTDRSGRN